VRFPLKTVFDSKFLEQVHHVGIGAEEDVETCFDPVSIGILPGGDLASEDGAGFIDGGGVPRVC